MPRTGLPVPANAEIAFEGFIHPGDELQEGPLGEWTGYYAGGSRPEPAIRIATMMHRNDPILLGAIPGGAAQRQHLLPRHLPLRRRLEPARSRRHSGGEGRVGARGGRQPLLADDLDQAALRRPRQAGRHGGVALPRRRLLQPLDHRGRRRHRSRQYQRRDLGDVHALRSPRGPRHHPRRLELGARPDVLRRRHRPPQHAHDHRRLQAVPAAKDVPRRGALEQGDRRPHQRQVGQGPAEGVLCRGGSRGRPLALRPSPRPQSDDRR